MAKRGNLDMLSSLPDDILSHILTFIPMKDAVQTSVLSTRWRYLFASMSTLDFDDIFRYTDNVRSLKKFVYRILHSSNQGSLECFRVTSVPKAYRDCLSHWVSFALRRGVKEIDLEFHRLRRIDEIVTPMFTCQSLVTLKLHLERGAIMFPSTVCLPNLKSFHFGRLILTNDSIPRLISSCSVLEDLVLYVADCKFDKRSEINIQSLSLKILVLNFYRMGVPDFDYVMVINAPSVVHFEYIGYIPDDFTTSNMTSLIKAEITILFYGFGDVDREQSIIRFLHGICNVRSLYLSIDDREGTLFPTTRIDQVLKFHNLVELEFLDCIDYWNGTWLVEFLHCVPNLKTLILDLASMVLRIIMFPPEEVPSCLSSHLKDITIKGITSSKLWEQQRTFEFISYFLDNAMVLEKLRLGIGTRALYDSSVHEQLKVFEKLLNLPRSSSTCQVLFF